MGGRPRILLFRQFGGCPGLRSGAGKEPLNKAQEWGTTICFFPTLVLNGKRGPIQLTSVELAAAFAASAAAAECVSAPSAGSVAGAFVLPAASAPRWRSVSLDAGVPVPAAARVSGVPDSASGLACPAVAGISGLVWRFRYLDEQELRAV